MYVRVYVLIKVNNYWISIISVYLYKQIVIDNIVKCSCDGEKYHMIFFLEGTVDKILYINTHQNMLISVYTHSTLPYFVMMMSHTNFYISDVMT